MFCDAGDDEDCKYFVVRRREQQCMIVYVRIVVDDAVTDADSL